MMGDDWRTFRARLVAHEQADEKRRGIFSDGSTEQEEKKDIDGAKKQRAKRSIRAEDASSPSENRKLTDILVKGVSSIFSSNHQDSDDTTTNRKKNSNNEEEVVSSRAFIDIDGIGGSHMEDPFASVEEIVAVKKPTISLDKHKWAHPISHVETGCVLLANERLGGAFHQTVVLIIDHHEATGTVGIIINRPLQGNFLKIASESSADVDLSLKLAFNKAPVSYGGPVMKHEFSVLHGFGEVEGSKKVAPGVFVGGSKELMREVRHQNFSPENALFLKGHAAWVAGQLTREIEKGVWYVASASPDFVLRYATKSEESDNHNEPKETLAENLWGDILSCMGGNHAKVAEKNVKAKGDRDRRYP